MRGWLLDVYADYKTDKMVLWIKSGKECRKLVDDFETCFYVHHDSVEELKDLGWRLSILDQVARTEVVRRKIDIRTTKDYPVLAVHPRGYGDMKECARVIDSLGGYYDYSLYNVDLRLSQRYLIEKNVYPLALVSWPDIKCIGGQFRVDYRIPHLDSVNLKVEVDAKLPTYLERLRRITVDDEVIEGSEEEMLLDLVKVIENRNPEVIYTDNGDYFAMPYLYHRAEVNDVGKEFQLGREPRKRNIKKKGKSYFTYGNIVYKPPAYTLKGRLHIDRSSFIFNDGGLHGLVDLARLSNLPLQTMSRLTPGSAITAMQVQHAMRGGYLILWKKNQPEDFKTAEELLLADRGGMIFDPTPGIYDGVVEVDFMSLYPNIMVRYNISPETLLCDCCPDSRNRVPELLYNICEKRVGLIPKVVKPLVRRRLAFKKMMVSSPSKAVVYKQRASLLKWVLVTCFGYTGYKNARFGRIECHEAINAYGREILLTTMELAEQFGYEMLHGIVDSLWLKPNGHQDHEWFCDYVSRHIGIPLDLEGVYRWIVFLPNKGTGTGALNRYYGLFDTGVMKLRGIEMRKHDTPPFIKSAQQSMLDELARGENSEGFRECIPAAMEALRQHRERLASESVDLEELVLTKRVSRTIDQYSQFNHQVAALLQLRKAGMNIEPGRKLKFVVCDATTEDCEKRVRPLDLMTGEEPYDVNFYTDLLARAGETLLAPFGFDEETVRAKIT